MFFSARLAIAGLLLAGSAASAAITKQFNGDKWVLIAGYRAWPGATLSQMDNGIRSLFTTSQGASITSFSNIFTSVVTDGEHYSNPDAWGMAINGYLLEGYETNGTSRNIQGIIYTTSHMWTNLGTTVISPNIANAFSPTGVALFNANGPATSTYHYVLASSGITTPLPFSNDSGDFIMLGVTDGAQSSGDSFDVTFNGAQNAIGIGMSDGTGSGYIMRDDFSVRSLRAITTLSGGDVFGGNRSHSGCNDTGWVMVWGLLMRGSQTITFPAIQGQLVSERVTLAATASSGLPVTYTVLSGPAILSDGSNLTFTNAGTVRVVARQNGNEDWNAAPAVTRSFLVRFPPLMTDYDGDGISDLALYEPTTGQWNIRTRAGTVLTWEVRWGYNGAKPVGGDYDGDGKADMAVYDDQKGAWYILTLGGQTLAWDWRWGYSNTVAVAGDYDGDGTCDTAIYDAAAGTWYIASLDGRVLAWGLNWGYAGTKPVSGDYDGDGTSDLALYDAATGFWYIRTLAGQTLAWRQPWGYSDATAVPGDYNGDGISDLAVYDTVVGNWYIWSLTGTALCWKEQWGYSGAIPVPGDYDGDGKYDLVITSASELAYQHNWVGNWFIRTMPVDQGLILVEKWGSATLMAVEGRQ